MKTITLQKLIESTNIPESLIRSTVRQSGGWESFKEHAEDVTNHGAAAGFSGWIYNRETEAFTRRNRAEIAELAESMAADIGDSGAVALVKGFNCLSDATEAECARALYGKAKPDDSNVENALAWFALEEVSRAYVDACDR
jgi:hypothetical protein